MKVDNARMASFNGVFSVLLCWVSWLTYAGEVKVLQFDVEGGREIPETQRIGLGVLSSPDDFWLLNLGPAYLANCQLQLSKQGRYLAYAQYCDADANGIVGSTDFMRLTLADLKTRQQRILSYSGETVDALSWSPDGEQLACRFSFFGSRDSRVINSIVIIDIKTGLRQTICPWNALVGEPKWSPDGRFVVYSLLDALNIVDLRAQDPVSIKRITDNASNYWWTSDSQLLVEKSFPPPSKDFAIQKGGKHHYHLVDLAGKILGEPPSSTKIPVVYEKGWPPQTWKTAIDPAIILAYSNAVIEQKTFLKKKISDLADQRIRRFATMSESFDKSITFEEALNLYVDYPALPGLKERVLKLASPKDKNVIITHLERVMILLPKIVEYGWLEDAKSVLLKPIRNGLTNLPPSWIKAVAQLRDPDTYDALGHYLIFGLNQNQTFEAIRQLPGIELPMEAATERALSSNRQVLCLRTSSDSFLWAAAVSGYPTGLKGYFSLCAPAERPNITIKPPGISDAMQDELTETLPQTLKELPVRKLADWLRKNDNRLRWDNKSQKYTIAKPE